MAARTEEREAQADEAVGALLRALPGLTDYGTVNATGVGAMTMPAAARSELGLPPGTLWRVLGSPELGVAVVIGPRRDANETLEFLLGGG